MSKLKTVRDIAEWRLCLGCGACAYICPDSKLRLQDIVAEGIRPQLLNNDCGSCSDCLKVCPAYENDHSDLVNQPGVSLELNHSVGPVLEIWEGYAADKEVRFAGASGGILTALALYCMEREGWYGVLHIGADPADPIRNKTRLSRSREELLACTGSRYAPASACDGLQLIESAPSQCVFIGQPSEVTALRKAERIRPELKKKVGLTLSFFCAGSPPTQATIDLVKSAGVEVKEVAELRYRGRGWPGMFSVRKKDDTSFIPLMTYQESWGFLQSYRPYSTHLFPDGTGEDADISCGDPWYREISSEEQGVSLIVARTPRGRDMLRKAHEAGYLVLQPADANKLLVSQSGLIAKRGSVWGRLVAFRLLGLPAPRLKGFSLFKNWWKLPVHAKARSTVGTIRRIIKRGYFRKCDLSQMQAVDLTPPTLNARQTDLTGSVQGKQRVEA